VLTPIVHCSTTHRCSTGSAALSSPPILPSASWLRARCEHNTDVKRVCCWPCFSACNRTDGTRIAQMGGILGNLQPAPGSKKSKTRKGRGIAAGQGATCGFGMRGQKSRGGRPTRLAGGERTETEALEMYTSVHREAGCRAQVAGTVALRGKHSYCARVQGAGHSSCACRAAREKRAGKARRGVLSRVQGTVAVLAAQRRQ
jgi:hypothetical protein